MLTIRPKPLRRIDGSAARVSNAAPVSITAISCCQRSGGYSSSGATYCSPALLISTSGASSATCASAHSTCEASATSNASLRMDPATSGCCKSHAITRWPCAAKCRVSPSPIPLAAPVMRMLWNMESKDCPPPRAAEEGRGGSIAVGRAHRDRARRAVEADLADVLRRPVRAEIVGCNPILLVEHVLAFQCEAPRLVRGRVSDAEIEQVVRVLVGDARGRVRHFRLAAVLVASVRGEIAGAERPAVRCAEERRPFRRVDRLVQRANVLLAAGLRGHAADQELFELRVEIADVQRQRQRRDRTP